MRDFSIYVNTMLTQEWLTNGESLYGTRIGSFQEGYGYGFPQGSVYCFDSGCGFGRGFPLDEVKLNYPAELIQYWSL